MDSDAAVVFHREVSHLDLQLARLADFFGIRCTMTDMSGAGNLDKYLSHGVSPRCLMVSARSLSAILHDKAMSQDGVVQLFDRIPFVLVYGITPDAEERDAVRHMSHGLVSSVVRFNRSDYPYEVSATIHDITREFSGLVFGSIHQEVDFGLVLQQPHTEFSTLVSINNLPFFGCVQKQGSCKFFLACRDITDIDSQTDGSLSAREYFSRIVPTLMFLRHVFQDQTWHNPSPYANFIIDDPLLRKSYGFLNYSRLLEEMDRDEFTTTIAFIPWNYRRTGTSTARLLRERSDRYSICVHGCDHTAGEYASTDLKRLNTQTTLATERMRAHEQRTGLPYAEAIVFPQGRFSTTCLGLLKSHNYRAAINSTPIPEDLGDAHGLTVADLLAPALFKYGCFPLFLRRYPGEVADFALDLLLGKPVLLVEHHNYFKYGYDAMRDTIAQINSLSKKLRWTGLSDLLSNTYLQRKVSPDTLECKIFTNHQIIQNRERMQRHFRISKQEDNEVTIQRVLIDGQQYAHTIEDGHLRLNVNVPPESAIAITIDYSNTHPHTRETQSLKYSAKVYVRRYLSELRDNYLCKHDRLLSLASRVKDRSFFKV